MVQDWLLGLPLFPMAAIIFGGTYLVVAVIWLVVTRLAVDDRVRAFKALSPGMLPPLGIIFGLLVGFTAAQVWSDFEKAKIAVSNEASALRSVIIMSQRFPTEQGSQLRTLINEHIETAVSQEWPAMAQQRARLGAVPTKLVEALNLTLSLATEEPGQRLTQNEIVRSIQSALDARRQRIIISQSTVSAPYSGCENGVARSAGDSDSNSARFIALPDTSASSAAGPGSVDSRAIHRS